MRNDDRVNLRPEEVIEALINKLSECNRLVSVLSKNSDLNPADLLRLRNKLMFTQTKARNLLKTLEEMKKPVNAFLK